jgi:hypothetical protein
MNGGGMVFFELNSPTEISNELACYERELEAVKLKIVITHKDKKHGKLFIGVSSLLRTEDELVIKLAHKCFGSIFSGPIPISSPSNQKSIHF